MALELEIVGGGGVSPGTPMQVDPSFGAGHIVSRPIDYGLSGIGGTVLGHYRAVGNTAPALFTANVILAALRWTDSVRFCLPLRVRASVAVATAVTAQRLDPLALFVARGYSVGDTTGATSILPSGDANKMRALMGTSLVANLAVTSAAGGLTGGTKTVDAQAIGHLGLCGSAAIAGLGTGAPTQDLYKNESGHGEHPAMLRANEGLVLQWGATSLATGTVVVSVEFEWVEVIAY